MGIDYCWIKMLYLYSESLNKDICYLLLGEIKSAVSGQDYIQLIGDRGNLTF